MNWWISIKKNDVCRNEFNYLTSWYLSSQENLESLSCASCKIKSYVQQGETVCLWTESQQYMGGRMKRQLPGSKECNLTTTQVLAYYAVVTNSPDTQAGSTGNIIPWLMAAYQLLPTKKQLSHVYSFLRPSQDHILRTYLRIRYFKIYEFHHEKIPDNTIS